MIFLMAELLSIENSTQEVEKTLYAFSFISNPGAKDPSHRNL